MKRRTGLGVALLSAAAAAGLMAALLAAPSGASQPGHPGGTAVSADVNTAIQAVLSTATPGTPPSASADGVGAFDSDSATWHLRTRGGDPTVFAFGAPGQVPLMGDWNGDGVATIGTYDSGTATVTLRYRNDAGPADVTYTLGRPGDVAIAGDFDGDGVDTVSLYRHDDGFVYVFNDIDPDGDEPAAAYVPAGDGGLVVAGDFDGDGIDTIGVWDADTGVFTINTPGGALESEMTLEAGHGRLFSGDWDGDGVDTPGWFDPGETTVSLRYSNTDGGPDETYPWGSASWMPVAGRFGALSSPVSVDISGAPQSLAWAVESLYLELGEAPYVERTSGTTLTAQSTAGRPDTVDGVAVTADAYGGQVAVVTVGSDTIVATSDDGWTWHPVGGDLESQSLSLTPPEPRFVLLIGGDARPGTDIKKSYADSIHIYGVNPDAERGAIVGISRDTMMTYNGPSGPEIVDGRVKISNTMKYAGPDVTLKTIADETGIPIEGWFLTSFGQRVSGTPGFEDLVDKMGGVDFLDIPYAAPSQCVGSPPPANPQRGASHVDGYGALAFSRERKCIPYHRDAVSHMPNTARVLAQGLLMKAAVEEIQQPGIMALPLLLDIMDDYVQTNLSLNQVTTLAQTLYGDRGIDPGAMPTLGPSDMDRRGFDAYNLNPGNLPNVVPEGCSGPYGNGKFGQWFVSGNYGTFRDFADGTIDNLPIYNYNSGDPKHPYICSQFLPSSVTRLAGSNRFSTAAVISQSTFDPGVPVTYIATGRNFPDALSAGPVAALNLGPILLVERNSIPGPTADELKRLKPDRIVIVGGTAAVDASVERQLKKYTSGKVTRLAGSNRFSTAAEISRSTFYPRVPVVHIATGRNFPDALAGTPAAALNGGPILLVERDSIPRATADELKRLKPGRIVIVGGRAVVSAGVERELNSYTTGSIIRLAEAHRFATAAEISKAKFSPGIPTAYIATGRNFPDALAGGPVAGYSGIEASPILLVEQNVIPTATRKELSRLKPHSIVIFGGSAVVSDAVKADLARYTSP